MARVRLPLLVLLSLLSHVVMAHMELSFPPPFRSKLDDQTPENEIDYSMTAPLASDGSNYPCKKYATQERFESLNPVAELKAGQKFRWKLVGSASHNGGSCQISIAYSVDDIENSVVLRSYIGGCPLESEYDFDVPANLPSAERAVFVWHWENRTGNRELYQNCALVKVTGGSGTSYTGPRPYRVNSFPGGKCINTENIEDVYPNPGKNPAYAGTHADPPDKPTEIENCDYDQNVDVTIKPGSPATTSRGNGGSVVSGDVNSKVYTLSGGLEKGQTATFTPAATKTSSGSSGASSSASSPAGGSTNNGNSGSGDSESSSGSGSDGAEAAGSDSSSSGDSGASNPLDQNAAAASLQLPEGTNVSPMAAFFGGLVVLAVVVGAAVLFARSHQKKQQKEDAHHPDPEKHHSRHHDSEPSSDEYTSDASSDGRFYNESPYRGYDERPSYSSDDARPLYDSDEYDEIRHRTLRRAGH